MLLLPTDYYLTGGALAVAASFLLLALTPPKIIEWLAHARLNLGTVPAMSAVPTSLFAFCVLCLLLLAGFTGSRDPLANPLPLAVWTVWWVGVTLLHAAFGNLWALFNPWTGPLWLVARLSGDRLGRTAFLPYPDRLDYWPAIGFFMGFAWLELIHPAPDDPEKLAWAVGLYWLVAFVGILLFGESAWRERAEPFSIFFRLVGRLSPLSIESCGDRRSVALAFPGAGLVKRDPLPLSGVLFVLLTLSSVSFDGLSRTFWWLALGDINPLEFPGRTDLMTRNSIGLLVAFAVLVSGYVSAVWLGCRLAGRASAFGPGLGTLIYSILPISIAFHFSHYLTALLVDGQYAVLAASDPFGTGLDLLGLGHVHVTTSFLNTYSGVTAIWNGQTAGIVAGHVAAVVLAHALALRHIGDHRGAVLRQIPLALMMVLYTLFGLWLLSTPVVG